jgi:FKBP-type peptidyl-prolyl cis-trans isomerase FkpA
MNCVVPVATLGLRCQIVPGKCFRIIVAISALVANSACGSSTTDSHSEVDMTRAVELSKSVTTLTIVDTRPGTGAEATEGRRVRVHYTGTLMDGTKFDSSKDRDQPFEFVLGARGVIAGWDEGVKGMKVGGVRQLTIPASMAYGARGFPPVIPPNAALKFEIELLGVE